MSNVYKTKVFTYREKHNEGGAILRHRFENFEDFDLKLLHKLPKEIEQYILEFVSDIFEQSRKYCIYVKYYKQCYAMLETFTYIEINQYFHEGDYFGMSINKNTAITHYLKYNLQSPPMNRIIAMILRNMSELYDDKYEKLKKIVICSNIRSAVIKMKQSK
jgi:hypothetical protein